MAGAPWEAAARSPPVTTPSFPGGILLRLYYPVACASHFQGGIMRRTIALLLFLILAPTGANALDNGFDVRAVGRPAASTRAAAGFLAATTNQFQGFVRFSAERQFFESMASNTA